MIALGKTVETRDARNSREVAHVVEITTVRIFGIPIYRYEEVIGVTR